MLTIHLLIYLFSFSFCMCLCIKCLYVFTCLLRAEVDIWCLSQSLFTLFLKHGLSLNLGFANSARLPEQPCLGIVSSPPCQGYQVFTIMLGTEPRFPFLYDKCVTDWTIFPAPLFIQVLLCLRVHPSQFFIPPHTLHLVPQILANQANL